MSLVAIIIDWLASSLIYNALSYALALWSHSFHLLSPSLPTHLQDDTSKPPRVAYSLVKHSAVYFESLYDLCKQYTSEPLPGCGFGLKLPNL